VSIDLPIKTEGPVRTGQVVSAIRRVRLREGAPVVLHLDPPSLAAEQYRTLAVQVEERVGSLALPAQGGGFVVTVTSAEEGAGKTLTSLNLALTLTRGEERKVLLVEGDLYRPQLHTYFDPGQPERPGLLQVIERQMPLAEAVVAVAGTRLDVLTAGVTGMAGDVLTGRRMAEVLAEMRVAYEMVVVDAPPMALLASARWLAGRSDGVVLVVRAEQSKSKAIEKVFAALGPDRLIGLVFNGAKLPRRGYRDYY
jgi:protein-tyrosine kinase